MAIMKLCCCCCTAGIDASYSSEIQTLHRLRVIKIKNVTTLSQVYWVFFLLRSSFMNITYTLRCMKDCRRSG